MPTSREIKALLRPLLERRPDLGFAGRTLFFAPLTHYLRGVIFVAYWTSSASQVVSFASQLYNGHNDVDFDADRQPSFHMSEDWRDDLEGTSRKLCEKIERYFLPPVEPITDFALHRKAPQYFRQYSPGPPYSAKYGFELARGSCTVGDFDFAEEVLVGAFRGTFFVPSEEITDALRFDTKYWHRAAYLLDVLRTDRSQVIPLLHDWEAYTVKCCKMTKYWKPSPFPCEL